ncbi:glycosyltransferase family 2 protein [Pseudonocardiaceae bacterium YIM PH 21723]|nr:glycosyltransferase family 2 protein [Pseudonocardiaceae bacterium YIM PH 21723]
MSSKTVADTFLAEQGGKPSGNTALQRVILPRLGDPLDVRALYLEEDKSNRQRTRTLSRTAGQIPPQSEVSFATYFNAFPASYWRKWTSLSEVFLRLKLRGNCRVDIYRSKADGQQIHVVGDVVKTEGELEFALELAPFEDGGWYWFDITSEEDEVSLLEGGWHAGHEAPGKGSIAIGICTYNRPDDCVAALAAVGEDPAVFGAIDSIVVADQGNKHVKDAEGFDEAKAALGDKLRIEYQGNMGGSGGFARGVYEALTASQADHILLMDDDIVVEPDSILRLLAMSRYATDRMLVGGQMLNLQARSHLHSMGEVVDRWQFMWGAAPNVRYDHDFARRPLRRSARLHRRIDVDYNGWWMCMIPRSVAEEIGLPLPLFIKWDDAEYGLRAQAHGYPTASLPGAAIWHMPWSDKDDATDWQAYFHLRNRLVVAALHGPANPKGIIRSSLKATMKHLLCLEYSTVALQDMAIKDFMAGPDNLFELLPTALGKVREKRGTFPDGTILPTARQLPLPSMDPLHAASFLKVPVGKVNIAKTAFKALLHNFSKANPVHHERPQVNVPAQDARWFLLSRLDGATVSVADGRGVAYRKRDNKVFRKLLFTQLRNYWKLQREYPRLVEQYRKALPTLTSVESWQKIFKP